jgi:hypothetical protein
MRRYFLLLVLLFPAHLSLQADTLDVMSSSPPKDQIITPSIPGSATDITTYLSEVTDQSEPAFRGISFPLTFEDLMMLEGTISTTDQETPKSEKFSIPQAIRAVPEISTFLLVATGISGAGVLASRRRLLQQS